MAPDGPLAKMPISAEMATALFFGSKALTGTLTTLTVTFRGDSVAHLGHCHNGGGNGNS